MFRATTIGVSWGGSLRRSFLKKRNGHSLRHLTTSRVMRQNLEAPRSGVVCPSFRTRFSGSNVLIQSATTRCYISGSKQCESVRESIPDAPISNISTGISSSWSQMSPWMTPLSLRSSLSRQLRTHSTMIRQTRNLQTSRNVRENYVKKTKRAGRRKTHLKRVPLLKKRSRHPRKPKPKWKKRIYTSERIIKAQKERRQRFVPLHVRLKRRRQMERASAAGGDKESGSWSSVDIAGASSALIEKYAVPPIQTIRKLATVPTITKGDLLSVMAVLSLLSTILVTPFVARYVWKSESEDYEDLEWDDPVAQTEKDFRRHISDDLGESVRLYMLEQLKKSREKQNAPKDKKDGAAAESDSFRERPRKVPRTIRNMESLLKEMLESEIILNVVTNFIAQVIESQRVNDALQGVLRRLWRDLINDPETTAQVVQLLHNGIQNREIKKSVRKLVLELINDKEVYSELQQLLIRLGNEDEVLSATQALLTESAHKALNDPEILDHSMAFATDVVGDDVVQRTSGEALRNTVSYAVRPGLSAFWALVGLALILFSFSALGNARSSEKEAEMIDRAFSTMARSVQEGTVSGVNSILSLPGRILTSCVSLIVSIVKAPFQLASAAMSGITRAGNAASRTISAVTASIIAFPVMSVQGAWSFLARNCGSVSSEISNTVGGLVSAVSTSFVGSVFRAVVGVCAGAVRGVCSGASTMSHAVGTCVAGVGHAFASVSAGVSEVGRVMSAWSISLFHTMSADFHAVTNVVAREYQQIVTVAGNVFNAVGLSAERVEKMVSASTSVLNRSVTVISSWAKRLFGQEPKPDPI